MATFKQKKAFKKVVENRGNVSKSMREAGYSEKSAKNPKNLTQSKAWKQLMDQYLPDKDLARVHKQLINSTGVAHMVFPTSVSDEEIKKLLATVNCTVKKIQHGDQAIHVWFWTPDNRARKDGLDMAYKLKGHYAPEKKEISGNLSLSELFSKSQDGQQ